MHWGRGVLLSSGERDACISSGGLFGRVPRVGIFLLEGKGAAGFGETLVSASSLLSSGFQARDCPGTVCHSGVSQVAPTTTHGKRHR